MTAVIEPGKTGRPKASDTIAALLLENKLIDAKQLKHATRIREKLGDNKSILKIMMELNFFEENQLDEALQKARQPIRLGDLLVELGDISQSELEYALKLQQMDPSGSKRLGDVLVEKRLIKEKRLVEVLANQLGYPTVEPDFNKIDRELFNKVNIDQLERYHCIPIRHEDGYVLVASTDPLDDSARSVMENLLSAKVRLAICSQSAFTACLLQARSAKSQKLKTAQNTDTMAMRLVEEIIQAGIDMKASDIHIEPSSTKLRVRFRTDSSLWLYKEIPMEMAVTLMARLKVLSKANIAERRRHQDGKIEFLDSKSGQIIDVRCSFYISIHGEKACLRLLNRKTELINIDHIGIAPSVLTRFKLEALEAPSGVVMVTGPTGSGKTTTLYSCVDYLNNDDTSIITAEEPVEYVIDGITQCSLNPKIDMTFAETLRHMVRQDPDIIVLGEIRDHQSAEAAIQSALTGHKVLTTFHTEDTIGGLLRLMNMDIETFLISSTVVSVLAQRLLKKVCTHCSEPYQPNLLEMQRTSLKKEDIVNNDFRVGKGCEACRYTGYSGRVGVFELLVLDERVKQAILSRQASYDIRRISIEFAGLVTLMEDGIEKASRGQTSIAEVIRMLPRTEPPRPLSEIKRLLRSNYV